MGMITSLVTSALVGAAGHAMAGKVQDRFAGAAMPVAEIVGRATVIDGDTIEIQRTRIRLYGIDAPESSQACEGRDGRPYPCGRRAAQALDELLMGKVVSCRQKDSDRYGRVVAVCSAGGIVVNAWMARNGQATAYTRYGADFAGDEAQAKRAGIGIWQGRFEQPSDYRQAQKGRGYGAVSGY